MLRHGPLQLVLFSSPFFARSFRLTGCSGTLCVAHTWASDPKASDPKRWEPPISSNLLWFESSPKSNPDLKKGGRRSLFFLFFTILCHVLLLDWLFRDPLCNTRGQAYFFRCSSPSDSRRVDGSSHLSIHSRQICSGSNHYQHRILTLKVGGIKRWMIRIKQLFLFFLVAA